VSGRAADSNGRLVRWLKFNAVSAIGIAVQLGALALLTSVLKINYLLATGLAVEAAVLHNFIWHERFTWADRRSPDRFMRLLKFNLTTGIFSIAGNLAFTKVLADAGVDYVAANTISVVLCSVINFFLNDRIVFAAYSLRAPRLAISPWDCVAALPTRCLPASAQTGKRAPSSRRFGA
jgi:putative flippase GtrA